MTKSTVNHAQTIGLIKQQQQALNTGNDNWLFGQYTDKHNFKLHLFNSN